MTNAATTTTTLYALGESIPGYCPDDVDFVVGLAAARECAADHLLRVADSIEGDEPGAAHYYVVLDDLAAAAHVLPAEGESFYFDHPCSPGPGRVLSVSPLAPGSPEERESLESLAVDEGMAGDLARMATTDWLRGVVGAVECADPAGADVVPAQTTALRPVSCEVAASAGLPSLTLYRNGAGVSDRLTRDVVAALRELGKAPTRRVTAAVREDIGASAATLAAWISEVLPADADDVERESLMHAAREAGVPVGPATTMAGAEGIEREDERTFDSGDFPKVIGGSMLDAPEQCDACAAWLGDYCHVCNGTGAAAALLGDDVDAGPCADCDGTGDAV